MYGRLMWFTGAWEVPYSNTVPIGHGDWWRKQFCVLVACVYWWPVTSIRTSIGRHLLHSLRPVRARHHTNGFQSLPHTAACCTLSA